MFQKVLLNLINQEKQSPFFRNFHLNFFHQGFNRPPFKRKALLVLKGNDFVPCVGIWIFRKSQGSANSFDFFSTFHLKTLHSQRIDFSLKSTNLKLFIFGGLLDIETFDFVLWIGSLTVHDHQNDNNVVESDYANSKFFLITICFQYMMYSIKVSTKMFLIFE